jgi:hypothetical protein
MLGDHYDTLKRVEALSGRTICGHGEDEPEWDYYPSGAYDGKVTSSNLAYPNLGMLLAKPQHVERGIILYAKYFKI